MDLLKLRRAWTVTLLDTRNRLAVSSIGQWQSQRQFTENESMMNTLFWESQRGSSAKKEHLTTYYCCDFPTYLEVS